MNGTGAAKARVCLIFGGGWSAEPTCRSSQFPRSREIYWEITRNLAARWHCAVAESQSRLGLQAERGTLSRNRNSY
jgi:hypothetical protein